MSRTKNRAGMKAAAFLLAAATVSLPMGSVLHTIASEETVEVWSTYATEKIMRSGYDEYASVRSEYR